MSSSTVKEEETRFNLLSDALKQTCDKITNNILSPKGLAECFPNLQKKHPVVLIKLQKVLAAKIQVQVKQELDNLLTEINLKQGLDQIDNLEIGQENLSKGEKVWRPTGTPSKDLLAHDYAVLQAQNEQLQNYSKELREKVEQDNAEVHRIIKEIKETEAIIEDLLMKNEENLHTLVKLANNI